MEIKNEKKEYNLSSVLNEMGNMNDRCRKKERIDLSFKLILMLIFIEAFGGAVKKLVVSINNNFLLYFINVFLIPFISFLAIGGLFVGLVEYFIDADYFNISSAKIFFSHKRRVFILSQMFLVYIMSTIIFLFAFSPLIYLIIDYIQPDIDIFFISLYLVDNYVIQTILFLFIGMVISGVINNAFIGFYFNTSYNSLLSSDKYSSFKWNLKGSLEEYFSDKDTLLKSLVIEVFFASMRIFLVLMTVVISKFFTEGKNSIDFIVIINIFKYIMISIMLLLDSFRMIYVSKMIADNIMKSSGQKKTLS